MSLPALAQPDDLPSEEIEVVKEFEAILEESEKLAVNPALPPVDSTSRKLVYDIPSKTLSLDYPPPKIRPIAMKGDAVTEAFKGYTKLGYGIPNSPYGELAYNHSDGDKLSVGGHIKHHSANYKKLEHQRFAETFGKLDGTYFFDQGFAVDANLNYTNDEVHFYGYDHTAESFEREPIRQIFKTFEFGTRFYNGERTNGDINYSAAFDFYRQTDNFAAGENNFDIELGATKWFKSKHPLNIKLITDFTIYEDTIKQELSNFYLQPNFTYHGEGFKIKLGANLTSNNDILRVFPDVEASYSIVGNKLGAFVGWNGDLQKNTMRSLSDYNPFIATYSRLELRNTAYNNFYGGVRGTLQVVDYEATAGLKKADNLALFLNDNQEDSKRFFTLYDTVDIFYIKGSVKAKPISGLEVILTVGQNIYTTTVQAKAWHLPSIEANASVRYTTLNDKLLLKGELFVENGVPFIDELGTVDNLNGLIDLSLGAEYRFSKNFGVFVDANNLASNNRQRWYRYPTYGLNILGGITARF